MGFLHDDIPYLKIGDGPPLVAVAGLTPEHDVPRGWERRMTLAYAAPLARHFTVYAVNRKRGLRPGESMSDIAGHLVNAIEHDLRQPVFLQGMSTGGSVALQLAVDRPDLVRRLVVVASAYRLGPGRALQAEMAGLIRAGDTEAALATAFKAMVPGWARGPVRPVAALAARAMRPDDPIDMLVTLDAEDAFDVEADLPRITAPTLVIGGTKDVFYTRELFEGTAAGVQDGRVHLFEGWGHGRTCQSSATTNITLGFLLAGLDGG
ncbi:MAG: alpha/beta hydrolase [Acidimicrobiales bacterium]|nr:alpha/beta hydrolase [Acidimicrobiales bacterium]